MKVAYLTTQYPAVSHSFIRREILAVEQAGAQVLRYSIRRSADMLPDPADQAEAARTVAVLGQGALNLLAAFFLLMITRPLAVLRGAGTAWKMYWHSGHGSVRHLAYLVEAAWLVRSWRAARVDHVHVHFGTNPTAVARIARRMGGPTYSFTVHGPDEFDNPLGLDLRGKIADARLCVGISSFGRSQLMRWADYRDWHKIAVVRCGIDDDFASPAECDPIPEAPELCCVARLSGQKGIPFLIDAAERLHRAGRDFHLTLVGDGELRSEVETHIAAAGLQQRISITGWASGAEVRARLIAARAMVLPSFAEGLPMVIMEALALGRPVVTTAIAGIPELVDAQCGWVVPAGDVDALVEAINQVLDASPEELAVKGDTGRLRVLGRHLSSSNGKALLELLNGTGVLHEARS